jgi:hypothetical protein
MITSKEFAARSSISTMYYVLLVTIVKAGCADAEVSRLATRLRSQTAVFRRRPLAYNCDSILN